jgi:hypothetical protein
LYQANTRVRFASVVVVGSRACSTIGIAPRSRPCTLNMPMNAAPTMSGNDSVERKSAPPATGKRQSATSSARSGTFGPMTMVRNAAIAAPHSAAESTTPIWVAESPSRAA